MRNADTLSDLHSNINLEGFWQVLRYVPFNSAPEVICLFLCFLVIIYLHATKWLRTFRHIIKFDPLHSSKKEVWLLFSYLLDHRKLLRVVQWFFPVYSTIKSWSKICRPGLLILNIVCYYIYHVEFFYIIYVIMSIRDRWTASLDWSTRWSQSQCMWKSFLLSTWDSTLLDTLNRPVKNFLFHFFRKPM